MPTNTSNSPTKPEVPGNPTDANIINMKKTAKLGIISVTPP